MDAEIGNRPQRPPEYAPTSPLTASPQKIYPQYGWGCSSNLVSHDINSWFRDTLDIQKKIELVSTYRKMQMVRFPHNCFPQKIYPQCALPTQLGQA